MAGIESVVHSWLLPTAYSSNFLSPLSRKVEATKEFLRDEKQGEKEKKFGRMR